MTAESPPLTRDQLDPFAGRSCGPDRQSRDPVAMSDIRSWVEALGDTNPLYVDDAAAKATGRASAIAPPAMLQVWSMAGLAGANQPKPQGARQELFDLLDQAGFTSVVATNCEQEYLREVVPGEWVTASEAIESVSDQKATALGTGYFITTLISFTASSTPGGDAELIGTQRWRLFRFAPSNRAAKEERPPRPRPAINRDNAFFFEGTLAGEIRIQRCDGCGILRHPPSPACGKCQSFEWTPEAVSGRGIIHSFVVNHHPQVPAFEYPLVVALVDLEEGIRFVAEMPGVEPTDVAIGTAVEARFRTQGDDLALPYFVLAGSD